VVAVLIMLGLMIEHWIATLIILGSALVVGVLVAAARQ